MRVLILMAAAVFAAGCSGGAVEDGPSNGTPALDTAPDAETMPDVDPAQGTTNFHAIGVCTRDGDVISCKGSSGGDYSDVTIARNGTISVTFEWTPQTSQTDELMVFISNGEENAGAEGRSPQTIEWTVPAGKYHVGALPAKSPIVGPIEQSVAWTATFSPS